MYPTFDGHNDLLLRLHQNPGNRETIWLTGEGKGHLDLPRMKQGGFVGGFFAIYIPSPVAHDAPDYMTAMENPPFALPLGDLITDTQALPVAMSMARQLLWMERSSQGAFKLCRTASEVRSCLASNIIAGIMHMEGAEPIDAGLDNLYAFYAMGLRSLGPVWSRPTIFGHGVPFAYPSSPDTGEGLTPAGTRLVLACNELKIMIDLSHITEKGFNDVARLSDAPLVATHSNAHAVTPSSRNLTDRQLAMIRESRGLVGLNFGVAFLREDGIKNPDTGPEVMIRHLDHLINCLGEGGVALGSDFDGTMIPDFMGSAAGLPHLADAMARAGYGAPLIRRLLWDNWLDVLDRTIG